MEDSLDNGSPLVGENREIKEFDLEKYGRQKASSEEPPKLKLKPLLDHLQYAF